MASSIFKSCLLTLRLCGPNIQPILCPQVQDEETQVSGEQGEDDTTEQEPWIGVVPVEMDDSKASTGNQESFTDTMVNKVRNLSKSGVNKVPTVTNGKLTILPLC